MTSRIPQYFNNSPQPLWKNRAVILSVAVVIGFLLGFYFSNVYVKQSLNNLQQQNEVLDQTNTDLYAQNEEFKSRITLLETEVKVKKEATKRLQKQYQELLTQQNEIQSEIDFYENLLNPNQSGKDLRVFNAELANDKKSINLTLAQKIERAKEISGRIDVQIEGKLDEKQETIKISDADLSYKFKYFQNISFEFSLPEGFQAQKLNVELIPSRNKRKKTIQTFSWDALSKNKSE